MTLGQFIINYRKNKNLSQRQFAVLCNVSNGYIAMVEKGLNPKTKKPIIPTLMQLNKLASGMGITVSELIDAVDDMPVVLATSEQFFSSFAGQTSILSQRMKEQRKEMCLSAEQLAEHLGVSPATIYRYENGDIGKIPAEHLMPIATVLQTTPAYLMGWEDKFEPPEEGFNVSENDLATKIRDLRTLHNLTLEQVARYVGVEKSTVRKWETGDIANMRCDKIAKLAVALQTTPAYLMGWELDPEDSDFLAPENMPFYREYQKLSGDDQEIVRQIVHIMHDRRKKENPPQD